MAQEKVNRYLKLFFRKERAAAFPGDDFPPRIPGDKEILIAVMEASGEIVEFNPACERLTGFSRAEVLGRALSPALVPEEEWPGVEMVCREILNGRPQPGYRNHWRTKSGGKVLIFWTYAGLTAPDSGVSYIVGSGVPSAFFDGQTERRRQLQLRLNALTASAGSDKALAEILNSIREYMACDAAAIRLRRKGGYPYIQTVGFPAEFIRRESLLHSGGNGGKSHPDCFCGQVLSGSASALTVKLPSGEAFFTGNVNELAARLGREGVSFGIRNYCGQAGYRSLLLIPLRRRDETIGLLQLNDSRADNFTPDDIDWLILAGQSIVTVLARLESEKEKIETERIFHLALQKTNDGFFLGTADGKVYIYNEAMERICGYTRDEVNRHGWYYLAFPNGEERRQAVAKARLAMAGKIDCCEMVITCKDGGRKKVSCTLSPLDMDGEIQTLLTIADVFPNGIRT